MVKLPHKAKTLYITVNQISKTTTIMKKHIVTIFLLLSIMIVPSKAQQSLLFEIQQILFANDYDYSSLEKLDSLVNIYGDEHVLHELAQIKYIPNDSLVLPEPKNGGISSVWYYIDHMQKFQFSPALKWTPEHPFGERTENFYTSNRMKLVCWAWLIYNDSIGIAAKLLRKDHLMYVLIDSIEHAQHRSGYLFDYINTTRDKYYTEALFRRDTASWVNAIDSTFETWKTILMAKGLAFLRKNNISPIIAPYKFIAVRDRYIDPSLFKGLGK